MKCFVIFLISACLIALLGSGVGCGNDAAKAAAPVSVSVPVPVPLTNMVRITAGTFQRIRFPVTLTRDFWIGKYEVSQGEFQAVMGLNPSHFTGLSNHPVEKVSFVAASNYCVKVTTQERGHGHLPEGFEYRLPTEAEWEFACRAGSTNRFYFGPTPEGGDAHAWTAENCEATTHQVGAKKPNAWGLHDMHGNVWEWCKDTYNGKTLRNLDGDHTSDREGGADRIFRGGSYLNSPSFARAGFRFSYAPGRRLPSLGLRPAMAVLP